MSLHMHPRTASTLEKLEKADWFAKVGAQDTSVAVVLSSWREAIEHCRSVEWENLCLEAVNQYRERLLERAKDRYIQWNDLVAQLKPVTNALVIQKIETVVRENDLPKASVTGDPIFQDPLGPFISGNRSLNTLTMVEPSQIGVDYRDSKAE